MADRRVAVHRKRASSVIVLATRIAAAAPMARGQGTTVRSGVVEPRFLLGEDAPGLPATDELERRLVRDGDSYSIPIDLQDWGVDEIEVLPRPAEAPAATESRR